MLQLYYLKKSLCISSHNLSTVQLIQEHKDFLFKIEFLKYSVTLLSYEFFQIRLIPIDELGDEPVAGTAKLKSHDYTSQQVR